MDLKQISNREFKTNDAETLYAWLIRQGLITAGTSRKGVIYLRIDAEILLNPSDGSVKINGSDRATMIDILRPICEGAE